MKVSLSNIAFAACVRFLEWLAASLDPVWPGGMDYVKVNVIIFCILLPLVLMGSIGLNIFLLARQ